MSNKKKNELEARIRDGDFGASTQFLYTSELEFRAISDFTAYDRIWQKFLQLKLELKQAKLTTSPNRPQHQLEKLTEKYKTPFEKRVFTLTQKTASSSESNRSRKRTADDLDVDEHKLDKPKKTKQKKVVKKKKKVKAAKSDDDVVLLEKENPSKKTKIESPSLVHLNKLVPKTPMSNRLSHRLLVNSTLKKTIKAKPLTRRAAAALAKESKDGGHVKKLVEKIEKNEKVTQVPPTPQTARKIHPMSSIQKTITKLKVLRSSIDKRKSALSMSKMSIKRKSEKQVKAFLNDIKQTNQIVITSESNTRISIHVKTPHDERLVKDAIKKSPQLVLAKMPASITQSTSVSANLAGKLMEKNEKRLSKELTSNVSIMSQYRPVNLKSTVSTSAIKATPSKAAFGSCGNLTNLYPKFTPSKLTRTEIDEKRKAELAAKEQKEKERLQELERQKQEKLNEAKKKREETNKKVNEKKQEMELKKKQQLNQTANMSVVVTKPSVLASAQKKILNPVNLNLNTTATTNSKPVVINQQNCTEFANSFKKSLLMSQQTAQKLQKQKTVTLLKHDSDANLEQTYVLTSPVKKAIDSSSYECTPLQPPKLKDIDNYDVSDIRSGDDTDDDEEPSKPIPAWAKEPLLGQKAQDQCLKAINFTRLFKSACRTEINLEQIFKSKRRKFVERSSSANWATPPVWSSNGLNGEESFMQIRKNC